MPAGFSTKRAHPAFTQWLRATGLATMIGLFVGAAPAAPVEAAALGVVDDGNGAPDIVVFEKWLGCPVQQLLLYTPRDSWHEIAHPQPTIRRFARLHKPAVWSIGMIPPHASLQQAATGAYDGIYVSAARALAEVHPNPDGTIFIRPGWELNGDWSPWAASKQPDAYAATYRHIVDAFRSVSSRFRFEWNINFGREMDPALAYPGDRYVDVVGMDFYWFPEWQGSDPDRAFAALRDDRHGLAYIQRFAAAHGKPVAFSEWGVQGDNAGPLIEHVRRWIDANHILYHNYWNSDADYPGRLSGGRWPHAGAAFRKAFCGRP